MLDKLLRLLTLLIVNALMEILFGGNIPYNGLFINLCISFTT